MLGNACLASGRPNPIMIRLTGLSPHIFMNSDGQAGIVVNSVPMVTADLF